jgi:hypothetical protein
MYSKIEEILTIFGHCDILKRLLPSRTPSGQSTKQGGGWYSEISVAQFLCYSFSLNPLKLSLTNETDTKKLHNFAKLQILNDKIDQNAHFA